MAVGLQSCGRHQEDPSIPGLFGFGHEAIVSPLHSPAKRVGHTRGAASHTSRFVSVPEDVALACYRPSAIGINVMTMEIDRDNDRDINREVGDLRVRHDHRDCRSRSQAADWRPDELHVVFGTGPTGLAVIDELVTQGMKVRAVNRSGFAPVPPSVEVVGGDATDRSFARRATRNADVVYQCLNPGYDRWAERFPDLQRSVVAAAGATGARLVVLENLYMYRSDPGSPISEDHPEEPHTRKGRVRKSMSDELRRANQTGRAQIAVGRASNYFGPNAGPWSTLGDRVMPRILAGKRVSLLGDPQTLHSHSYLPDIGRGLVTLGTQDKAIGQIWHLPNAPALSTRELIELLASAAGTEVEVNTVPWPILRLLSLVRPMVRETMEMLYEYDEPFVVDSSRFTETFGTQATPLAEAAATTVEWYRSRTGSSLETEPWSNQTRPSSSRPPSYRPMLSVEAVQS